MTCLPSHSWEVEKMRFEPRSAGPQNSAGFHSLAPGQTGLVDKALAQSDPGITEGAWGAKTASRARLRATQEMNPEEGVQEKVEGSWGWRLAQRRGQRGTRKAEAGHAGRNLGIQGRPD